jgi:hypothetical protein
MTELRIGKEQGLAIPDKFYVAFRRDVHIGEDRSKFTIRLGFATPITGRKAEDEKRKLTVDKWAGKHPNPEDADLAPVEVENTFKEGFKLVDTVNRGGRGSYFGSSRTVWRVQTPEGFELEIDSGNLALIMNYCTLENGLIKDECIWGRKGTMNFLLPKSSKMVEVSLARPDNAKISVAPKDVKPGDIVLTSDGTEIEYVGKFFFVTSSVDIENAMVMRKNSTWRGDNKEDLDNIVLSVKERQVFKHTQPSEYGTLHNNYNTASSLKFGAIVSTLGEEKSKEYYTNALEDITNNLHHFSTAKIAINDPSYSSYGTPPILGIFATKKEATAFSTLPVSATLFHVPAPYAQISLTREGRSLYNNAVQYGCHAIQPAAYLTLVKEHSFVGSRAVLGLDRHNNLIFKHKITGKMINVKYSYSSLLRRNNEVLLDLSPGTPNDISGRKCDLDVTIDYNDYLLPYERMESASKGGKEMYVTYSDNSPYFSVSQLGQNIYYESYSPGHVIEDVPAFLKDLNEKRHKQCDIALQKLKYLTIQELNDNYDFYVPTFCVEKDGKKLYFAV